MPLWIAAVSVQSLLWPERRAKCLGAVAVYIWVWPRLQRPRFMLFYTAARPRLQLHVIASALHAASSVGAAEALSRGFAA